MSLRALVRLAVLLSFRKDTTVLPDCDDADTWACASVLIALGSVALLLAGGIAAGTVYLAS